MKLGTILFATKLAAAFSGLTVLTLIATALLFRYTAAERLHEHGERLVTAEGTLQAHLLEDELGDEPLTQESARGALRNLPAARQSDMALVALDGEALSMTNPELDLRLTGEERELPCGNRRCIETPQGLGRLLRVPLLRDGQPFATLIIQQRPPVLEYFWSIVIQLLLIHLSAVLLVILLSHRIARPIRVVSRKMNQIAGGDLGHRVRVRGHDEVARMSHSFNAMADRVEGMIRGSKEMLAGVSHELRSPLGRMKLSLEMLRDAGAPKKHIDSIDEDVDTLDAMVDELLTASRLDLGTATLEPAELSLADLARRSWRRLEGRGGAAPPELTIELAPSDLVVRVV